MGMSDAQKSTPTRIRTLHLRQFKAQGRRFAMLTTYDAMTAGIFDQAALAAVVADRIAAWGLAEEPELREFTSA